MTYLLHIMGRWMSQVDVHRDGNNPEFNRRSALGNLSAEDLSNAHDWLLLWADSVRHEKHQRKGGVEDAK